jgi:hypothetical protein
VTLRCFSNAVVKLINIVHGWTKRKERDGKRNKERVSHYGPCGHHNKALECFWHPCDRGPHQCACIHYMQRPHQARHRSSRQLLNFGNSDSTPYKSRSLPSVTGRSFNAHSLYFNSHIDIKYIKKFNEAPSPSASWTNKYTAHNDPFFWDSVNLTISPSHLIPRDGFVMRIHSWLHYSFHIEIK